MVNHGALEPQRSRIGMRTFVKMETDAIVQTVGIRGDVADLAGTDHGPQVTTAHQEPALHGDIGAAIPQHRRVDIFLHRLELSSALRPKVSVPGKAAGYLTALELDLDQLAPGRLDALSLATRHYLPSSFQCHNRRAPRRLSCIGAGSR